MPGGIFISYRREDSAGFAGRIYDRLVGRLDRSRLFFDVDNIEPGLDFVKVLSDRVGACDALIAIIGKEWLSSSDTAGHRRLDDPRDFVRIEIEAALARDVRVIPVLVGGAAMPREDDLPETLRPLVRRQGMEVSHARFDLDADHLARWIQRIEEIAARGEVTQNSDAQRERSFAAPLASLAAVPDGFGEPKGFSAANPSRDANDQWQKASEPKADSEAGGEANPTAPPRKTTAIGSVRPRASVETSRQAASGSTKSRATEQLPPLPPRQKELSAARGNSKSLFKSNPVAGPNVTSSIRNGLYWRIIGVIFVVFVFGATVIGILAAISARVETALPGKTVQAVDSAKEAIATPTATPNTVPASKQPAESAPASGALAAPKLTGNTSSARAAMLIGVSGSTNSAVSPGSVVWSTIPPAPGQPATVAVKAEADIPDLKMHAVMTLRNNTDPSLPASHTIDLRVTFADGAEIEGIKDMSVPLMRRDDPPTQDALSGVRVKISDSYFLVGLNRGHTDLAHNVNLIANRGWFDFPMVLNDERIAKLTFEKGPTGERIINEALAAWK
jgi:hypothetical protein